MRDLKSTWSELPRLSLSLSDDPPQIIDSNCTCIRVLEAMAEEFSRLRFAIPLTDSFDNNSRVTDDSIKMGVEVNLFPVCRSVLLP
jgi:hypothetical protein